jgi:hypothetical protein
VLRAREHAPTPFPFTIFTFGLAIESIKELGGALGMLMRSWAILGSNGHTFCSKHNIGSEGCNCKFRNLFLGVWCVIEFGHFSIYLHLTYSPYQSWGLGTDGVWILLAHWIWHLDINNMFWLWLNISPSGWSWFHCRIVAAYAFLDRILSRFGVLTEVLTNQNTEFHKIWFNNNQKNYYKKNSEILLQQNKLCKLI